MLITHQTQPTDNTCMSTVLAMILGKPVNEVIDEFHEDYVAYNAHPKPYLEKHGVEVELTHIETGLPFGLYILAVPSLNHDAHLHAILVNFKDNGDVLVYDPNKGREGKRHYIPAGAVPRDDSEVALVGWFPEYRVIL